MAGVPARLALHLVLRGAGSRAGGLGRGARPGGHRAPGAHAGRGQPGLLRDAGRGAGHHSPRPHRDLVPVRPARIPPVPYPSHLRVDRGRPAVHRVLRQEDDATAAVAYPGVPGRRPAHIRRMGTGLPGGRRLARPGRLGRRPPGPAPGDRAVRGVVPRLSLYRQPADPGSGGSAGEYPRRPWTA